MTFIQQKHYQKLPNVTDRFRACQFARRIIYLYCLIYYLLPFSIFIFIGNPLEEFMLHKPNYWLGITYVGVFILIFYLATKFPFIRADLPKLGISKLIFGSNTSLVYAFIFALLAYWTNSFMGLNFRQSGVSLSDIGAAGFLLEGSKMISGIMIIVHFRMVVEGIDVKRRSAALLLLALGYYFSLQGAFDIFFIFCALTAGGYKLRRVLGLHKKIVQRASIVIFPILVYFALFIGTANKIGIDKAMLALVEIEQVRNLIIGRIGYNFYGTSIHITDNFINFSMTVDAISELIKTTYYRLSVLFSFGGVEKPNIGTTSRLNFLYMSPTYHPRIGASPSILGSAFYWPYAGLSIVYLVFIMRVILILIWNILGNRCINWLFIIYSMILFGSIMDASLDSLNPFSSGFIRFFTLLLGARFVTDRLAINRSANK